MYTLRVHNALYHQKLRQIGWGGDEKGKRTVEDSSFIDHEKFT